MSSCVHLKWDCAIFCTVQVTWHRGVVDSTRCGTRAMLRSTFRSLRPCRSTSRRRGFHSSLTCTSSSAYSRRARGLSSRRSTTSVYLVSFQHFHYLCNNNCHFTFNIQVNVLAGTPVKNWRTLLEQSFAACMPQHIEVVDKFSLMVCKKFRQLSQGFPFWGTRCNLQ